MACLEVTAVRLLPRSRLPSGRRTTRKASADIPPSAAISAPASMNISILRPPDPVAVIVSLSHWAALAGLVVVTTLRSQRASLGYTGQQAIAIADGVKSSGRSEQAAHHP